MCLHVWVQVPVEPEGGTRSLIAELLMLGTQCGLWEANSGPPQDQQGLFTAEPSLQHLRHKHLTFVHIDHL